MIAELGLFSLILALIFAVMLVVVPTTGLYTQDSPKRDVLDCRFFWLRHFKKLAIGLGITRLLKCRSQKNQRTKTSCFEESWVYQKKQDWINAAPFYAIGQFLFVAIAYLCLTLCFLRDDFSVTYVMSNSSVALPWFYKLCAVWGGHEGSMLLWVAILSAWMLAVSFFSKTLDTAFRTRVLVVLGAVSIGFILFLLITSNPFSRQFVVLNTQGRDLNPLLQDPGFLFHPPMLYMGYVGFSVAFAFALAALWMGKLEPSWAKWTRPWTLAAWCCLTLGITLGSWWAYRELGWGGWWFWDPVENASFMPWLVGTALLHSLAVSEQRQQFMAWTLLLAITAFSLSLIGTFLVRSGVLTSVHAFAVDPQRGLFILCFLLVVIGGSLLLFALRAHTLQRRANPAPFSRESALLLNNVFLAAAMLTVLMGTVYPLLIDGLGLGKLSVGAPYFNSVFVPLMIPLLLLMGLGVHLKWQQDHLKRIAKRLLPPLLASVLCPLLILYFYTDHIDLYCLLGLILALWILFSTLALVWMRGRKRGWNFSRAFYGMILAHCGVAVTVIGISVSTAYGIQDDVRMGIGKKVTLAGYSLQFVSETPINGPNYHGAEAKFVISKDGKQQFIYPQKRIYNIGQMAMTESAIDANVFRDIYVALGEPLDETSWSVRVYLKPFVRWIWGGGFLIFVGGLMAMLDRRYAKVRQAAATMPTNEIPASEIKV